MTGLSLALAVALLQPGQPAPVVTIAAADLVRAEHLTIAPSPLWRIGGDGDGPYAFTRVVGGTFLRDGGVAVLETDPPQVRVYDRFGKHVQSFGRKGRGPGEFEMPQWVLPHVGDSLLVSSMYRVSVFDAQGEHARTVSTVNAGAGLAVVRRVFADGSMLATAQPVPTPGQPYGAWQTEGITRDSTRLVILSPAASSVIRDFGRHATGETVVAFFDGVRMVTARAFSSDLLLSASDSLLLMSDTRSPVVDVRDPRSGRSVRVLRLDLSPRAVSARDKEHFAQTRRAAAREGLAARGAEAYLKRMTYPEHMPYFDVLRWSYDRLVRLRRYTSALDSSAQWITLTLAGRPISVIDMPSKARVLDFDDDRVLLGERDADDLEHVALYKLIPRKP